MLEIGIYHPQIPQNTGTLLRVSSCLGVHVNIIGPMGFIFDDTKFRRAGMDYIATASYSIYTSFDNFFLFSKAALEFFLHINFLWKEN